MDKYLGEELFNIYYYEVNNCIVMNWLEFHFIYVQQKNIQNVGFF